MGTEGWSSLVCLNDGELSSGLATISWSSVKPRLEWSFGIPASRALPCITWQPMYSGPAPYKVQHNDAMTMLIKLADMLICDACQSRIQFAARSFALDLAAAASEAMQMLNLCKLVATERLTIRTERLHERSLCAVAPCMNDHSSLHLLKELLRGQTVVENCPCC